MKVEERGRGGRRGVFNFWGFRMCSNEEGKVRGGEGEGEGKKWLGRGGKFRGN